MSHMKNMNFVTLKCKLPKKLLRQFVMIIIQIAVLIVAVRCRREERSYDLDARGNEAIIISAGIRTTRIRTTRIRAAGIRAAGAEAITVRAGERTGAGDGAEAMTMRAKVRHGRTPRARCR